MPTARSRSSTCTEAIDITRLLSISDPCFGKTVWQHLLITLTEGVLAFVIGAAAGIVLGFWLARTPLLSAVFDPYIKMLNALPRVVLAPIFMLWLGLGIWSKVALGVTLVFFIVFFNVYQGVKEVSPAMLANARMLGMNERQLFAHVYWPSALSWMFSSLHTSVGFAIIGAVVGEYLGSAAGLGYMIQQAEGTFDTTGVFAGMVILAVFVLIIDWFVTLVENRLLVWRPRVPPASQELKNTQTGSEPMQILKTIAGDGPCGALAAGSAPKRRRRRRRTSSSASAAPRRSTICRWR